jgi:diguanylate cyclase (GGDEF)-like protein/PAS domain S-box-containing protein
MNCPVSAEEKLQLRDKQIELLYEQSHVGLGGTMASAVFLVIVFWPIAPRSILLTWFFLLMALSAVRLNLLHRYRRSRPRPGHAGYWLAWFLAGTVVSGATWGLVTIVLVPDKSIEYVSFALLWIGALSAGAVGAYSVIRWAFWAFSVPALIPTAVYLLSIGGQVEMTIGAGTIMYLGFLSLNALRMHNTIIKELTLQFENTQLITHLAQERERVAKLNDQLERRVVARTVDLSETNARLQREIAQRKRTEEALRQAAAVFENTTEGVIITDTDDRIVTVNKAFTDITGYGPAEVIGKTPRALYSGQHDESFFQARSDSIAQTGRWQGEVWKRHKEGRAFPVWLNVSTVRDEHGGVTYHVNVFSDITPLKDSQARLEHLAHHDALTGLPNRLLFQARADHALLRARREAGLVAVLLLDLDHFKNINDSLGHPAGDHLLHSVTKRLQNLMRAEDTVARLGGDEFILLLEGPRQPEDAAIVADKIIKVLATPFDLDGHQAYVSGSIGISVFPDDGQDVTTLIKNADSALYRAKEQGRNGYHFYTKDLTAEAFKRLALESTVRRAVEDSQFTLYYQPQISLSNGHIVGAEALVRWQHPTLGLVLPSQFIPMAESMGLIVRLGEWILHTACAQTKAWQQEGLPPLRMAVNVSSTQMTRGRIIDTMERILKDTGLDSRYIELEITEGLIMQQTNQTIATLEALKAMGIRLAIDDFGTGYSSLSYLKRLPLHRLKIDRSFIREIPYDSDDVAITRAVIALGINLQLIVVAEGVETQTQLEFLRGNGCDEAQGYLCGRPLPPSEFADLVRRSTTWYEQATISSGFQ